MCKIFAENHPKNLPKDRNSRYLEDPGIRIRPLFFIFSESPGNFSKCSTIFFCISVMNNGNHCGDQT